MSRLKNKQIGNLGESVVANHLVRHGFTILERNYLKKWGEIDIIAVKSDKVHFIEVKTVSYETKSLLKYAVTHETWRPEEMVHKHKQERFKRVIDTWLSATSYQGDWQIDVITLRIVPRETYAVIKVFDNLIFE